MTHQYDVQPILAHVVVSLYGSEETRADIFVEKKCQDHDLRASNTPHGLKSFSELCCRRTLGSTRAQTATLNLAARDVGIHFYSVFQIEGDNLMY